MRLPRSMSAPGGRGIADGHDERELIVGDVGRGRGERLRALDERQRLLVENCRAGAANDAAAQDAAVPIDAERQAGHALLAARLRRIALVAFELRDERTLPAH